MKRLIPIFLGLLLLCGCAAQPQPTTVPTVPTTEYVEPTEPAGSYLPDSQIELATGGAVRLYPVTEESPYAMAVRGSDVLLFSGLDHTVLTLMTGENLYTVARTELDVYIYPEDPSFCFSEHGITYYDRAGSIVFLDEDLKEVSRKQTPEAMTESPILSHDRTKLYYCTADALRMLDLETGIDRLVKEMSFPSQWLERLLMNDSVLWCTVGDEDGQTALFLSAETGELLYQRSSDIAVSTGGENYFAQTMEGMLPLNLFGRAGEDPQVLNPRDPFASVWYLADTNHTVCIGESQDGLHLDYMDLESGLCTASLTLSDMEHPMSVEGTAGTGLVYLLTCDAEGNPHLLRWDTSLSLTGDETVYTGQRFTLENPDENGLALCEDRAYGLSQSYGVEILVGMDAVANEPWDFELYPEHQVPVIQQMLDQLEQLLQSYPDGFFTTLAEKTTQTPVRICLVRAMYGSPESGSLDTANGIQFWQEDAAYVAMAPGSLFSQTFYHEMFHVIETCVYGHSNAYDDWNKLNPDGFEYDYDYIANQDREAEAYLVSETRSFIDTYSMSYPKEDRARIMEYAATEGNESYFLSDTMQKKLTALCTGIREAFDLREYPNVLPWEQYLEKPLTP